MARFELNEDGVKHVEQTMFRPDMRRRAEGVAERARARAPRGPETIPPHEHLKDSIVVEEESDELTWHIGSRNRVALIVETGSRPHEIRPHAGGVLAWRGADGKMAFAKVVHHPGTRAQPYLRPALYTPQDI